MNITKCDKTNDTYSRSVRTFLYLEVDQILITKLSLVGKTYNVSHLVQLPGCFIQNFSFKILELVDGCKAGSKNEIIDSPLLDRAISGSRVILQ